MKKSFYPLIWVGALAVIAFTLLVYEHDFLWKIQEENLFLNSSLFFRQQMVVSGGMLSWLGAFCTQFLHFPWLGVLLLCGTWLLLMWLAKRTFNIPDRWATLLLIPVALLLIAIVDTGYWLYVLKLPGYFFAATIGTLTVVLSLWAFRALPSKYALRPLFIAAVAAVGYPLFGIYALTAVLLMGVWSWRLEKQRPQALISTIVAIASIIAVPLVCYHFVYYQTNLANIYYTGLPVYFITENHRVYYLPYLLLFLFFLALTLTYKSQHAEWKKKAAPIIRTATQVAVVAALAFGVFHFWFKDENFHHELTMQHRLDCADWEGVIDEAREQEDEPTRPIVMMRNIALSRLGRQGDEMFLYKNGSKAFAAPFGMRAMLEVGPLAYYQYGMLNYCNRLCIEMGVEFGVRAEHLKYLVKSALLNGEQQLARKYIGLLKQTLFFDDWADQAESFLKNPKLMDTDPELAAVKHMLHHDNVLGSDQGFVESYLMRRLANNYNIEDPVFQEQALLATLYTHDVPQFWTHFANYIRLHPDGKMPRYYQEAAYLYGKLEGRQNLDNMPFDSSVKAEYNEFMRFAPLYDGADVEEAREGLRNQFAHTYYYQYYTMGQLPEY
jgi:hypothetical protein